MKSILQSFRDLKQTDWDYYDDIHDKVLNNPFAVKSNPIDHDRFVHDYFYRSGKANILKIDYLLPNSHLNKNHTNSIFFLGILIHKNTDFQNLIRSTSNNYLDDFSFLWFLTSLFHDYAYSFENDQHNLNTISDFNTLIQYFQIDSINNLLDQKIKGINSKLFQSIVEYFNFRIVCHRKIDHGILAGVYLFDKLVKIRIDKEKKGCKDYNWGKEIEKTYAMAASAIAVHNIWIPSSKDKDLYKHFGLKQLVDFKPIKMIDSPLLYLFGIVDTIDPVKTFSKNHSEEYILDNLEIDLTNKTLYIGNKKGSKLDFSELNKKSDNYLGWLNVSLTKNTNSLLIKMK